MPVSGLSWERFELPYLATSPAYSLFFQLRIPIDEKPFKNLRMVIPLGIGTVSWRLIYAFTEKKECSKEEKACGKDREITKGS